MKQVSSGHVLLELTKVPLRCLPLPELYPVGNTDHLDLQIALRQCYSRRSRYRIGTW